jgi:hypothetical protein
MVSAIQFINVKGFFEKLSQDEARAFLERFLNLESSHIKETVKQCAAEGIIMDYSMKSIPPFLRWLLTKLKKIQKEPNRAVPKWLRNHEVYVKNLFDFDEPSGILVVRAGYYLGESFVRSHGSLRWGTGDIEIAHANMPVVTGFENGMEMPPVIVADNLLATLSPGHKWTIEIKECLEAWNSMALKD